MIFVVVVVGTSQLVAVTRTSMPGPPLTLTKDHRLPFAGTVTVTDTTAVHDWGSVRSASYYNAYLLAADGTTMLRKEPASTTGHQWTGLTPCRSYGFQATSVRGNHESPRSDPITATTDCVSPTPTPTPSPTPDPDPYIAGAGDIAASNGGSYKTAALLDGMTNAAAVFTTGDNAYPDGTDANYADYYEPTWGRHKPRTRPSPGNHDYHVTDAAGYFNYFGALAGERPNGWYSYNVGTWHLIALNSSRGCSPVPCGPGSPQYEWLRNDLLASPALCTVAYWHHPRWSSGNYGDNAAISPLWDLLYDHGADVVLTGHDHNYQRHAPLNKTGQIDVAAGIREFVVGTGGNSTYRVSSPGGRLEASQTGTLGVLKLMLKAGAYDWRFVPEAGKTYSDAGSGTCH